MDPLSLAVGFLVGGVFAVIVAAVAVYFMSRSQDERIAKYHRGEI